MDMLNFLKRDILFLTRIADRRAIVTNIYEAILVAEQYITSLLEYNARENQARLRKYMSLPSLRSKNKFSEHSSACYTFGANFLQGLFYPEDRDGMFI
jgi:hypothetical protein